MSLFSLPKNVKEKFGAAPTLFWGGIHMTGKNLVPPTGMEPMTLQSKHVFLTTGLLREVVTTINAHRGDSDRDFLFLTKETGD